MGDLTAAHIDCLLKTANDRLQGIKGWSQDLRSREVVERRNWLWRGKGKTGSVVVWSAVRNKIRIPSAK